MKKKTPISSAKTKTSTRKKSSSNKSTGRRIFFFLLKTGIALLLLGFLLFLIVYVGFTGPVPSSEELQKIKNPVSTEVYAADGRILGRYYIENRSNVSFDQISPNVINALIATEDSRFYHHTGIDEIALLRVFLKSVLLQDHSSGGGSTLSQQVAKNLYPRKSFGPLTMPVNKLRESIIAYRLEKVYTKDEILTLYLNTVPFAENTYGIGVASERFFNKPPSKLKVPEAATLVGMLKANNSYNPRKNPERSLDRRNVVIDQMLKYNYISVGEAKLYKAEPLNLTYNLITYNEGPAPYLMEKIRPFLQDWCDNHMKEDETPYNLFTDGLKIRTTIDFDMQLAAENAVSDQMKNLQAVFDAAWGKKNPWGNDKSVVTRAMKRSNRYRSLKKAGVPDDQVKTIFNTPTSVSLFTWDGKKQAEMTPMDSIQYYLKIINTGFMAMDPNSGELKAYIGGNDFRYFQYDHTTSKRQVGSTFKPIVYLAALEAGISPDTYFPNERKVYEDYDNWSPENSHDEYTGFYSMEGALSKSINTIAVEVMMKAGISNVVDLAKRMGIDSDLPPYPSLALGTASVSLQEMVCAYSELVNGGRKVTPYYLKAIESNKGQVLEKFQNIQPDEQVASPENCRIITQMLKSVVNDGTGSSIRSVWGIDSEFAGKTGTTQDQADGWFIGMTPTLVAGAWVGGEDPSIHFRSLGEGAGGKTALPIVGQFYSQILHKSKYQNMRFSTFESPSEESMAMLNIPPYREVLEVGLRGIIHDLFGKKETNPNYDQKKQGKSVAEPNKEEAKPTTETEKKPFWQSMKEIFKKKSK
ncbi:penicillin-binding protein 1A [Aquipluma nitroreducens]|uniref:penicillin-binding protein 1A n=1 Tax=Aquipluma nitroreducens TaxID=2010828 RepID=UPI002970090E|nr:transglycosylase domain-containing protein [Aquipluma nitroreducens]